MTEVWKKNCFYAVFRPYVNWCVRNSVASVKVIGKYNIPDNRKNALFLAVNHTNTLMDPLIVLESYHKAASFGTRADVFRKKGVASILNFLKMIPISRHEHEGQDSLRQNMSSFGNAVDSALHEVPFVIFPEGTHRPKHSLLPIRKGVIHMALQAAAKDLKPVYIVPVGIDYSDYFLPFPDVRISFGSPIPVTAESEIPALKNSLSDAMKHLITYFPDDENYETSLARHMESVRRPRRAIHYILALLLLPVFAACAVLSSPLWLVDWLIVRNLKDRAWSNTVRFGVYFGLLTVTLIALAALAATGVLPWYIALGAAAAAAYSKKITGVILNLYRFIFNK